MVRLHLVVEGQTEQGFVNRVLRPYLANWGIFADARCVETSRKKGKIYRGGVTLYNHLRKDMERWLKQEKARDAVFSTMVDLYGIPNTFPGYEEASGTRDPLRRAKQMEKALADDIGDGRFIPYIQIHEFEALLFCDPSYLLDSFPNRKNEIESLRKMAAGSGSPEEINDGDATAPSKRIIDVVPEYGDQKATVGPLVAGKIGIEAMKDQCPHFREWLTQIENLPTANQPAGT